MLVKKLLSADAAIPIALSVIGGLGVQLSQNTPNLATLFTQKEIRLTLHSGEHVNLTNEIGAALLRGISIKDIELAKRVATRVVQMSRVDQQDSKGSLQELKAFDSLLADKSQLNSLVSANLPVQKQPLLIEMANVVKPEPLGGRGVIASHSSQAKSHSNWMALARQYLNTGVTPVTFKTPEPSQKVMGIINAAAKRYGVPRLLLLSICEQESAFRSSARSHAGAIGMCQILPTTAAWLHGLDPKNPAIVKSLQAKLLDSRFNINTAALYLSRLISIFPHRLENVVAAYNAGPGSVQKHGGVPPFGETIKYVEKVKTRIMLNGLQSIDEQTKLIKLKQTEALVQNEDSDNDDDVALPYEQRM